MRLTATDRFIRGEHPGRWPDKKKRPVKFFPDFFNFFFALEKIICQALALFLFHSRRCRMTRNDCRSLKGTGCQVRPAGSALTCPVLRILPGPARGLQPQDSSDLKINPPAGGDQYFWDGRIRALYGLRLAVFFGSRGNNSKNTGNNVCHPSVFTPEKGGNIWQHSEGEK